MKIAVPFFRKIWIFRRFSADGESSIVCFGFAFAWPPHHRDSLSFFAFTRCPTILVICFSAFSSPGKDCRFQLFLRQATIAVFSFFFTGQGLPFSAFSLPGRVCRFQFFLHRAGFAVFSFFFTGQRLSFSVFSSPGRVCRFQLFLHRAELLRFFTTPLPSSIYDWVCTFAAFIRLFFSRSFTIFFPSSF